MSAPSNSKIALWVSLGLSAALVAYVLSGLDWPAFWAALGRLNLWYLPLMFGLQMLCFYIRAIRWKYLLPPGSVVTTGKLFEAIMVGMLATFLLPLRAGEFIRPWALSRQSSISFSSGFASIVTERVFDVMALLVLLAIAAPQIESMPPIVMLGAQALAAIAATIVIVMLIAYVNSPLILTWGEKVLRFILRGRTSLVEKILRMFTDFVHGLKAISTFPELLKVLFWSLILWLEVSMIYQAGMWAFGEWPSFWVGLVVNLMICLAVAAPSAPGFIGTFQFGCVVALDLIYHYSKEFAVAYSIVAHMMQVLGVVAVGFFILNRIGLHFAELRSESAEAHLS